ncbi:hypothetical protein Ddc_10472 [Ditylenchus destructor]|nr:hypothetical protein Ddc_10472 [Ditylenchus destructor]
MDSIIRVQERFSLQKFGIPTSDVSFGAVTMESDKYIVVRQTVAGIAQVVVIDIAGSIELMRRPINADSALMNPEKQVLALKADKTLQLFDLEEKKKIKAHTITEPVIFWKWINSDVLGIVTESPIYHWRLSDDSQPVKVFVRHATLASTQITNYCSDAEGKFLLLVGIAPKDASIAGSMQLYSTERNVSQLIEGHAACFTTFMLEGNKHPSSLLCFSSKIGSSNQGKLNIIEVTPPPQGDKPFERKTVEINYPRDISLDFPILMQVSSKHSLLYLVTKYGYVYLFDIETGTLLYAVRVSADSVFLVTENLVTNGILAINKAGQVLNISLDERSVVPFITQQLQKSDLALKVGARCNLPGAEELFTRRFNLLFASGSLIEAAKVAATAPRNILRTTQTLRKFQSATAQPNASQPMLTYFAALLDTGMLTKDETLELCRPTLQQNQKVLVEKWISEGKLDYSEEFGDLVKEYDINLAVRVYLRGNVCHKVIECFSELGQFEKIILYAKKVNYDLDYMLQLRQIIRLQPEKSSNFAVVIVSEALSNGESPLVDEIIECFLKEDAVRPCISFLLAVATKINNWDVHYKAMKFYLEHQADLLNDLLIILAPRLDIDKTIAFFSEVQQLAFVKPFLQEMQRINNKALNECLNQLFLEEEDHESLSASIRDHDNFDHVALAQQLENHHLSEFRRISAYIFKKNDLWKQAIEICKRDELYTEAIDYAAQSCQAEVAEDLLQYFLSKEQNDHFAATLSKCYGLLRPDVILELAWRHKNMDFAMPYFVQVLHDYNGLRNRVEALESVVYFKNDVKDHGHVPAGSTLGNNTAANSVLNFSGLNGWPNSTDEMKNLAIEFGNLMPRTSSKGKKKQEMSYNGHYMMPEMSDQQQQWFTSSGASSAQYSPPPNVPLYSQQPQQWFIPPSNSNEKIEAGTTDDFENEPPLLEELGINFQHIRQKTLAVLNPVGMTSVDVVTDQDLAGPLVFCLLFGASLLLQGKIHFGYIYGIGLVGCVGMYTLLNLMAADQKTISFTCTVSVLGYALLPMSLLSMMAAVLTLQGIVGYLIAATAITWCSASSSKLFSIALAMQGQKLLVAYPCALLYAIFALLAIF